MARMDSWMKTGWAALVAMALMAGCETGSLDNEGTISLAELQGITPAPPPDTGGGTGGGDTGGGDGDDGDTGGGTGGGSSTNGLPSEITTPIRWLNVDVSNWAQTASLNARVGGGTIYMPYDKATVWPNRGGVNANCWAIVNIGGTWYAATFEYLKVGQQSKPMCVLAKCDGKGDHFKVAPLSSWTPHSGERFGIMVSGLARGGNRNVQERSNISMVTWP